MSEPRSKLIIHALEASRLGDGLGDGLGPAALRSLSSRAVLLSDAQDTVIVDAMPDPAWLRFLAQQGIELGTTRIAHGAGDTLAQRIMNDPELMDFLSNKSWSIEPYMGGDEVGQLAEALNAKLIVPPSSLLDRLNLKSNLQEVLEDIQLPTIPTTVAPREEVIAVARSMFKEQGPIMVRSDLSIGGHGVWKVDRESDFEPLELGARRSNPSRLFILQPLLDVANSPNVQYDISDSELGFLGISAQNMTQSFAFGGNNFPSPLSNDPKLRQQADEVAQWLQAAGYRGVVGIDFVVTTNGEVFIVEINPRVNTSTFPLLLSKRLGRSAFRLTTEIPIQGVASFDQLATRLGPDLIYDAQRGVGVVPLMLPSVNRPKLDAMVFADDSETVDRLSDELHRAVGSACVHAGEPS